MRRRFLFVKSAILSFVLLLSFILSSCTHSKWDNSWPTFSTPPLATDSIVAFETDGIFTLMRAKWFSNKYKIQEDASYEYFEKKADSILKTSLLKWNPNIQFVSSKMRFEFPEETIKFDKKIFLKGRFPEQGKAITFKEHTPKYLLLVHEITLGVDLDKEYFFNNDLKQTEMDVHKTVESVSVILTFTLWDNLRQIPLYSAILEEDFPVKDSIPSIDAILTSVVERIPFEILKGAK